MSEVKTPVATGGCQCGAVRYALYVAPREQPRLPLPHVPARHGRAVRGARRRAEERVRLDQGRAGVLRQLQPGQARLLPRLRHAAVVQL